MIEELENEMKIISAFMADPDKIPDNQDYNSLSVKYKGLDEKLKSQLQLWESLNKELGQLENKRNDLFDS